MSNVNTLKAIQCLIGSNCIVSTPDAFYVGPKGLISNAEIVQTLDEHNTRISANTSNIVDITADIQSIYEDINTITAQSNNTKTQLNTLQGKVQANTSNINVLQEDLNTVNDDINTLKTTLNSNNERLNGEIQLLKDTDDAIYETFNEHSEYISANTQNIQNQDKTILSIQQTIVQLQDDTAVHDLLIKENTKDINNIKEFQPTIVNLEVDATSLNNLSTGYYAIKDSTLGEQYSSIVGHIRMYDSNTALVTGLLSIHPEGNIYTGSAINSMFRKANGSWEEV